MFKKTSFFMESGTIHHIKTMNTNGCFDFGFCSYSYTITHAILVSASASSSARTSVTSFKKGLDPFLVFLGFAMQFKLLQRLKQSIDFAETFKLFSRGIVTWLHLLIHVVRPAV